MLLESALALVVLARPRRLPRPARLVDCSALAAGPRAGLVHRATQRPVALVAPLVVCSARRSRPRLVVFLAARQQLSRHRREVFSVVAQPQAHSVAQELPPALALPLRPALALSLATLPPRTSLLLVSDLELPLRVPALLEALVLQAPLAHHRPALRQVVCSAAPQLPPAQQQQLVEVCSEAEPRLVRQVPALSVLRLVVLSVPQRLPVADSLVRQSPQLAASLARRRLPPPALAPLVACSVLLQQPRHLVAPPEHSKLAVFSARSPRQLRRPAAFLVVVVSANPRLELRPPAVSSAALARLLRLNSRSRRALCLAAPWARQHRSRLSLAPQPLRLVEAFSEASKRLLNSRVVYLARARLLHSPRLAAWVALSLATPNRLASELRKV